MERWRVREGELERRDTERAEWKILWLPQAGTKGKWRKGSNFDYAKLPANLKLGNF